MLCTLLSPTAGTASVAGIDVVHDPARVRQRIGLVFQDPSLDDQLTGREQPLSLLVGWGQKLEIAPIGEAIDLIIMVSCRPRTPRDLFGLSGIL